jgi:hypothetical protein
MLQAGRSCLRFPMRSLDFSIDLRRTMALATQPLTEMSTRSLPGGKGRPESKADSFMAICELVV